MKKILSLILTVLCATSLFAQAPEKFSYQAVVRNASNALVTDAPVGVRVSILQGDANGNAVYVETHTAATNANGLLTVEIGGGKAEQGSFAGIDWANGPFFLKTETDPNGGGSYTITSTQQLLSVPYALYAREAANSFSGDYNDLKNKPTIPQNVGELTNDAGYITLGDLPDPTKGGGETDNSGIVQTDACGEIDLCEMFEQLELLRNQLEPIVIQTEGVTAVTQNSFTVNGKVLTDGNSTITQRGFVYGIDHNPSISNYSVNSGTGTGTFTSTITGLDAGITYYVRAFATNENGTFYGNEVAATTTATTPSALPSVTTITVTNITTSEATVKGAVTSDGGENVTQRGFVYDTLPNPTTSSTVAYHGTGTGQFSNLLSSLHSGKTYYVRAFATNSIGTAYGNELTFTLNVPTPVPGDAIPCPGAPTVTDHEGNVYNTVQIGTQCWTKENLRTTTSPSTGTYLIPPAGTTYTYSGKQAFWYNNDSATYAPRNYGLLYNWNAALDTFNTAYGELSVNPTMGDFNVSFMGNRRGICPAGWHLPSGEEWVTLTDYLNSHEEYRSGGLDGYVAKALASANDWYSGSVLGDNPEGNNVTGFSAVPAGHCFFSSFDGVSGDAFFWSSTQRGSNYATICNLVAHSAVVEWFIDCVTNIGCSVRCLRDTTGGSEPTATLPTVTTGTVSDVTATTATCGGEVTSDGGAEVIERGVCWSVSENPTTADNHTTDGTGLGTFTSNITNLTVGITYYVRAYATNSMGTAYGEEMSFTTTSGTATQDGRPCPGTPTVTDHEGNVYNTVQIGNQCWMRDNLRTTTSPSTGTYLIPPASPGFDGEVSSGYTYTGKQARWKYNDSVTYAPMNYGLLYNWNAAVDTFNTAYGETSVNNDHNNALSVTFNGHRKGICPEGWHLPSDEEWTQLTNYVSSVPEYQCGGSSSNIAKALASMTEWWYSDDEVPEIDSCSVVINLNSNNATGFGAVPVNCSCTAEEDLDEWFDAFGDHAYFWSSTQLASGPSYAYGRCLLYYGTNVLRNNGSKKHGFSVRCLRDELVGGDTTEVDTCTIRTLPYSENFERYTTITTTETGVQPACWEVISEDVALTDATKPQLYRGFASSGSYSLRMKNRCVYAMPALDEEIEVNNLTMTFQLRQSKAVYRLQVGVINENGGFELVQTINNAGSEMEPVTVDFSNYTGNGHRIAFRNTVPSSSTLVYSTNYIDDIVLDLIPDGSPCPGTPTVTDHEGNVYNTVKIGDQCWMKENLRTTKKPDGSDIILNNERFLVGEDTVYGYLYTWNAMMNGAASSSANPSGVQGICPMGWHVPSDTEWTNMIDYLSSHDIYNATDFTTVRAGYYDCGNINFTAYSYFWSATEYNSNRAWYRCFSTGYSNAWYKSYGLSVRCLRGSIPSGGDIPAPHDTTTTPVDTTTIYGISCLNTPTVTDNEGNVYHTVQIGNQCWMKENLRTTKKPDGSDIILNNERFLVGEDTVYGYLYTWNAMMNGAASSSANPSGVQGICPMGWHVPSDTEWTNMIDYLSSHDIYNATDFTTVRAGYYDCGNINFTAYSYFWSATEYNSDRAWHRRFSAGYSESFYKSYGLSVRCLRDEPVGDDTTEVDTLEVDTCVILTLPYSEDFESYTTTTTTETGVQPACWEVVAEDVTLTDATKPQLYRDFATSGSYSLRMKNRCVYAMPAMNEEIEMNNLTMTFQLRQSKAVYRLQVGVINENGEFELVQSINNVGTEMEPVTVDFSNYTGNGHRIAFRNTVPSSSTLIYSTNYIDDIVLDFSVSDGAPCPGTPTVTDHEGNVYNTVQIGNQCWTKENLRTTTSPSTGTYLIPDGSTGTFTGKQARWANNDSATYAPLNYGLLYNWNAAMDTFNVAFGETIVNVNTDGNNAVSVTLSDHRRGICPVGWHLPSDAEWTALTDYVGNVPEYQCGGISSNIAKALASESGWWISTDNCAIGNDQDANNATGFSAVPASGCDGPTFYYIGGYACFWSSTESSSDAAWYRDLYGDATVGRSNYAKTFSRSVRCLRD